MRVMSWHIHYNTNTTSQQLFYNAFIAKFAALFPPTQAHGFTKHQCPFGPNFGARDWKYICSLEGPYQEHSVGVTLKGSPWNGPQRAFVVPPAYIDEAWVWAQANKFEADVLKHANTGCMHDDHGLRAEWNSTLRDKCSLKDSGCKGTCGELIKQYPCDKFYGPGQQFAGYCDKTCGFAPSNPTINTLEFPCNMPGTGWCVAQARARGGGAARVPGLFITVLHSLTRGPLSSLSLSLSLRFAFLARSFLFSLLFLQQRFAFRWSTRMQLRQLAAAAERCTS